MGRGNVGMKCGGRARAGCVWKVDVRWLADRALGSKPGGVCKVIIKLGPTEWRVVFGWNANDRLVAERDE